MAINLKSVSINRDSQFYDRIDREIKYCLESQTVSLSVHEIHNEGRLIGLVVQSLQESDFYPGNAVLQLDIQPDSAALMEVIWKIVNEIRPVEAAITTTEDLQGMSIYQKHYDSVRPVALCFDHGSDVKDVDLPPNARIEKAGPEQRDGIKAIWKDILEFYKATDRGDIRRTNIQLDNGDLCFMEVDGEIVGLGSANIQYATQGKAEIAYAVKPKCWRKGYATQIAKHLKMTCRAAGMSSGAHCDIGNWPSMRVLQKSGMSCRAVKLIYDFK
jgi:predicted acetyltransferase